MATRTGCAGFCAGNAVQAAVINQTVNQRPTRRALAPFDMVGFSIRRFYPESLAPAFSLGEQRKQLTPLSSKQPGFRANPSLYSAVLGPNREKFMRLRSAIIPALLFALVSAA